MGGRVDVGPWLRRLREARGLATGSSLLNGRTGISVEMAVRLSKASGSTPETWLGMRMAYDLWQARAPHQRDHGGELPGWRPLGNRRGFLSSRGLAAGAHGVMGRVSEGLARGRGLVDLRLPQQQPAYPLCTQSDWRGDAAPPFEPPASRAAAEAPDGRGRSPRTPTPVRARRSGAPLWSMPTSPRRSRSPSTRPRRPSGSPMPGSGPPRPSAPSASCRPTSAPPSRTAPPAEAPPASAGTRRRRGRKPSRRDQSRRRRGLGATPNMRQPALQALGFGAVDRTIGGGSLPAPLSAQERRAGFGSLRPKRNGANGFGGRSRAMGTRISTQKRGGRLICG